MEATVSVVMKSTLFSMQLIQNQVHGSETWPVRKENEVALQRAEMRMVRWMCGIMVKDRLPSMEEVDEGCLMIRMGVSE